MNVYLVRDTRIDLGVFLLDKFSVELGTREEGVVDIPTDTRTDVESKLRS